MKIAALTFLAAFFAIVAVGLLVVMWQQHEPQELLVDQPQPVTPAAARVVIPWTLNTRCTVNSKNLPLREQEIRT